MIKILIVEDEPPIARMLSRCIEQMGAEAFLVAGKAINGQAALDILANEEIDVVITDIRMPVMDGLELLGEIDSRYPDIISVVLSGYQDFDYASTALRYGVFDYLLKPISQQEVGKLLHKLLPICQSQVSQKKKQELEQILQGGTFQRKGSFDCTAILICAGPFPVVTDDILLPSKVFWEKTDLENLCQELLGKQDSYFVFDGKTVAEKYIILERAPFNFRRLVKELFNKLTALNEISVTMVCHGIPVPIAAIGDVIRSLRACLYKEIKICSSNLIWYEEYEDERKNDDKKRRFNQEICHRIVESICLKEEQRLIEAIGQIIQPNGIAQVAFIQMIDIVIADSRLMGEDYASMLAEVKIGLNDAVSNSVTALALCYNIASVLLTFGQSEQQKGKRENQAMVDEIEQYLMMNYSKSISSDILSKKFGFVPSYLSKVFRSVKGMSPSEYLTNYRVDKAKQIIREKPDILIREAAKAVGYEDQYYFSKIFKKYMGMWPKEYQEIYSKIK